MLCFSFLLNTLSILLAFVGFFSSCFFFSYFCELFFLGDATFVSYFADYFLPGYLVSLVLSFGFLDFTFVTAFFLISYSLSNGTEIGSASSSSWSTESLSSSSPALHSSTWLSPFPTPK